MCGQGHVNIFVILLSFITSATFDDKTTFRFYTAYKGGV